MKKLLSILLSTALLAAMLVVLAVPASAAPLEFGVNAWDPETFGSGSAAIFTVTDCDEGWACHAAFAPTSQADVWTLVDYATSGDADGDGEQGDGHAVAVPEGGFVWSGMWSQDIDNIMKTLMSLSGSIGVNYKITGLDLANKTCAADATIERVLGENEMYISVIDPVAAPGGALGVVYMTNNNNNGWWSQIAFKPVEGKTNVYEIVETVWADGNKAVIPEGGFVWAIHSECAISAAFEMVKNMGVGQLWTITGVDVANKTFSNPKIVAYVEGEEPSDEPVESTPVESTPVESTPVESTPVESTPVESTPVESTPVESTPVESTPVESTPATSTPATSTPATSTPSTSTPSTGDASSMIMFAVIALVAIAGSAVVIKNRK